MLSISGRIDVNALFSNVSCGGKSKKSMFLAQAILGMLSRCAGLNVCTVGRVLADDGSLEAPAIGRV